MAKDAGKKVKWSRAQQAMPPGYVLSKDFVQNDFDVFYYKVTTPEGKSYRTGYLQYAIGRSWVHFSDPSKRFGS
jgi:hypothetical protein